jgi:hypothetical protein
MLVYLANLCCQKVLCALCPGVVGWKCFSHGPLTTAAVLDCRSRLKQNASNFVLKLMIWSIITAYMFSEVQGVEFAFRGSGMIRNCHEMVKYIL